MFGNRKPQEDDIKAALKSVAGVSIDNLIVADGDVRAVLSCGDKVDPVATEMSLEQAVKSVRGVKSVHIILTAEREGQEAEPKSRKANTQKIDIDAKHIIAVASGKGGVGKSTVAMNIAAALSKTGMRVGLLDADVYGPSVPRMTGLSGQKPGQNDAGKIVPLRAYGMDVMSIGFMIGEESPLIWRGPMVQSAFTQMAGDVAWQGLDVLVIDLPPGTGDVQLTMAQRIPLTGAVIVSTPQDIALIDARKGIEMFRKVDVPILGLVENMSYYCCPSCGHNDHIFGHGGAKAEAEKLDIPFLGDIPLNGDIRAKTDAGEPIETYFTEIITSLTNIISGDDTRKE